MISPGLLPCVLIRPIKADVLKQAELALRSDETPVGCVFVHNGKVIARGMNGTNATLNVSIFHFSLVWSIF